MTRIEKFTISALLIATTVSAALFGIWEDKVTLYAPLLVLVYIAFAVWAVGALRRRQRSEGRRQKSESDTPLSEPEADLSPSCSALRAGSRPPASCGTAEPSAKTAGSKIPPGGILLLLFLLYSALMIPFSVLPYEAKISTLRLGCYVGTYWVAATILSRFAYRKAVWTILLLALLAVALYSLVQHRQDPSMLFGVERYTDQYWAGKSGADAGSRLGGTYICPNHIAHLYQMWIPLCLVCLFVPQFGWFWRISFAYSIPLFLLLIYQTESRAGLLGVVAALGTTFLLVILRKSRTAFWISLLVVPLLCAGAVGGLYAGSAMFRARMQPVFKFIEHQMQEDAVEVEFNEFRPQTWLDTIDMIKDRPVFGFGPGNYGLTYEDYRKRVKMFRRDTVHPHNEYLELIAEYGLVGALLVFCALICLATRLIRFIISAPKGYHALPVVALLAALAGTAVHGFFDFELRIFPNAMMLALLAGCAVAPLVQQKNRRPETQSREADAARRHGRKPSGSEEDV